MITLDVVIITVVAVSGVEAHEQLIDGSTQESPQVWSDHGDPGPMTVCPEKETYL